jgi:hypothetical protein
MTVASLTASSLEQPAPAAGVYVPFDFRAFSGSTDKEPATAALVRPGCARLVVGLRLGHFKLGVCCHFSSFFMSMDFITYNFTTSSGTPIDLADPTKIAASELIVI